MSQPLVIGPLAVTGYDPGTAASLDLQLGASDQVVAFSGGVQLLDMHARINVNASLLPSTTFSLNAELDFTSHLTFELDANMRGGSFKSGAAGLKALDFDVHAVMHQDILDYLITQVNTQIIAAKHSLDDGATTAQKTLDDAQKDFEGRLETAKKTLADAQIKWRALADPINDALAKETAADKVKVKQLTDDVTAKAAALKNAIDAASNALTSSKTNREIAMRAAQQHVIDVKADGDAKIDAHLRDLNKAKEDMQHRFGDADASLASAKRDVDAKQKDVDKAQRDYDSAKHDLDHAKVWEKIPKTAKVTEALAKLGTYKGYLETAKGVLTGVQKTIDGPGYAAAKGSVNSYQQLVNDARTTANASLNTANLAVQETQHAQDQLVDKADNALQLVQSSGIEKHAADAATGLLKDYQIAEAKLLAKLSKAVDDLADTAEAAALKLAQAGLAVAQANTKDVDLARAAITEGAKASGQVMDAAGWMMDHTGNILNLRSVTLTGDFRGMAIGSSELSAQVVGTFAEHDINFAVDFTPGKGEEMAKRVFQRLLDDMKSGLLKIAK
jgi:hypothetical protein